jgi:hypothetical protein
MKILIALLVLIPSLVFGQTPVPPGTQKSNTDINQNWTKNTRELKPGESKPKPEYNYHGAQYMGDSKIMVCVPMQQIIYEKYAYGATLLKCSTASATDMSMQTLYNLYKEGWKLIQVVDTPKRALYYLERK